MIREANEWASRNDNALHCLRVMVDEHLCEEIDNLLSESDWNAPYKGGTT